MMDQLIEWIAFTTQRWLIRWKFKATMGYAGDFENPRTYQEKIQFRKLYGNHAFYALMADKYRVREYVAAKVGEQHLIPLLGAYDRLNRTIFDDLPDQFIIKANHGCKWNQVVNDKSKLDVDATVRRFNRLIGKHFGFRSGERHYALIKPKIVIEQLLQGPRGGLPWDYYFQCCNGPDGFEYHTAIVAPDGKRSAVFDNNWRLISSDIPEEELAPHWRPANFETMVQVAKSLSADFDFVRVDLYTTQEKVYFGELTCTPHQGYGPIKDPERQRQRDRMWHLDSANPLLYRPPKQHRMAQKP
jgi:TupA-like ATPgrasp